MSDSIEHSHARASGSRSRAKRVVVWLAVVLLGLVISLVSAPMLDAVAVRHAVVRALESAENGSSDSQAVWMLRPSAWSDTSWQDYVRGTRRALDGKDWRVGEVRIEWDRAWAAVLVEGAEPSRSPDAQYVVLWRHGPGLLGWQVLDAGRDSVFTETIPDLREDED